MSDDKVASTALRVRSPNYPSMGLQSALEQTEKLFKKIQTHAAPRDVVLAGLGYTSYNGASASALSAQLKYGLLMKVGQDYRVTDQGLAILEPRSADEKAQAVRSAAIAPLLFAELIEQYGERVPDDSLLRANLIRKGFGASAVAPFIQAFRETMEFSDRETAQYDFSPVLEQAEEATLIRAEPEIVVPAVIPQQIVRATTAPDNGEREMLHGPLSRTVSYRLIIRGQANPKDLGKLIKILELQKSILEDDDEEFLNNPDD